MCISLNKFIILCSRWIPRPIQLFFNEKNGEQRFWQSGFSSKKKAVKAPAELFWTSLLAFVIQVLRYVTKLNVSYTKIKKRKYEEVFAQCELGMGVGRGDYSLHLRSLQRGQYMLQQKEIRGRTSLQYGLADRKKNLNEGDYWWFMKVFCRHWWRLVLYEDKLIFNLPLATRFVQGASYFQPREGKDISSFTLGASAPLPRA